MKPAYSPNRPQRINPMPRTGPQKHGPQKPAPDQPAARRGRLRLAFVLLAIVMLAAAAGYWWTLRHPGLPAGFVQAEGRLETAAVPILANFASPIDSFAVKEGELVKSGQIIAQLDISGVKAELARTEALVGQARLALDAAAAEAIQRRGQLAAAEQDLKRWQSRAVVTKAAIEQRQATRDAAAATAATAAAGEQAAAEALDTARKEAERLKAQLSDDRVTAPKDGRIRYVLADVGETPQPGAPIATLIDPDAVFVALSLPEAAAAHLQPGAEAMVVLEALPDTPFAGSVSFVAGAPAAAKAAPADRHVRVHVAGALVRTQPVALETGMRAKVTIRTDPAAAWPPDLAPVGH